MDAIELLAKDDLPLCDIKIYFCDYPIKPSDIEPEQLRKVREFKKKVAERDHIFHWPVNNKEAFKRDFRRHLADWFQEYIGRGGRKRLSVEKADTKNTVSEEVLYSRFRSITKGF